MMLDPAIVDRFRHDGFVVVPDVLRQDELDHFGPIVDAAVAHRKAGDRRALHEKTRYEQSFVQCINLWEDTPDVRPLTFHPRIAEAAAALLGAERVRLWHDQALYKEAGGRETDAHQDLPYWPIAEPDAVTAWIPLDGSTVLGGAMGYLPGSHRVGVRKFVNIFTDDPPVDLLARPELATIEPVWVEVPPGAVAYHHSLTVHLAGPNRTDRPRRVHTAIYFRDGCTRGSSRPHPSVDRAGIAVGDVIASAVTPVAWPRPPGDIPPAPPVLEGRRGQLGPWPGRRRADSSRTHDNRNS